MNPIVNIKAVTMRSDAIFKNVQNGTEVEGCVYHKVPMSAQILRRARTVGGLADVKNVLVLPGIFGVVVQMRPRYYGEARNVLMSVLSSEYQHPKVAIAVDEDVDIFNDADSSCGDQHAREPGRGHRGHHRRQDSRHGPVVPGVGHPGAPGWHRIGGKVIIDATKPPECVPSVETSLSGCPVGWETVKLEDYLPRGLAALRIKPKIPEGLKGSFKVQSFKCSNV